ncbi:hypothetical protein ACI2I2_06465 [Scandinavium sp. NPDC088450]|uniref:hypothetical protein n=1 Tax=Scandinavium sp. NPDC088450 TaxID=3364514 RepID=UPI00384B935A
MPVFKVVVIFLAGVCVLSLLFSIIYSFLSEKKYLVIKKKFKKEFGYVPSSMVAGELIFQYGIFAKDFVLISAFIFPRALLKRKVLTEKEISFIKSLDNKEISWVFVKHAAFFISIMCWATLGILMVLHRVN